MEPVGRARIRAFIPEEPSLAPVIDAAGGSRATLATYANRAAQPSSEVVPQNVGERKNSVSMETSTTL